jgi:hypothetical protein
VSALEPLYEYIPRQPDDDLLLTGLLLTCLLVAVVYLILWWLAPGTVDVYGFALDSIGLLLLAVGFFGFLILRALDQLQSKEVAPGPGIHPARSPLLVYSASYTLTAATLALLALAADLGGVSVVARFLDLFVTLFAVTIVYLHVSRLGEEHVRPILRDLTLPRWRAALE